ncbi:hypothetical protein Dimus_026159 [Dionaea muscipula]
MDFHDEEDSMNKLARRMAMIANGIDIEDTGNDHGDIIIGHGYRCPTTEVVELLPIPLTSRKPAESDIGMAANLHSSTPIKYTSLKDIMSSLPPMEEEEEAAAAATSTRKMPFSSRKGGCRCQVDIKDPLVKQAALAYLQPNQPPPPGEVDGSRGRRSWNGEWKGSCCLLALRGGGDGGGESGDGRRRWSPLGCIEFASDVVFERIRACFGR